MHAVPKAVRDVLQSPSLFSGKPVLMRAFQAVRRTGYNHQQ